MSDPVTATELVEVVAAALVGHAFVESKTLHQHCRCGWFGEALRFDHAAHQARAVLAVLTEVGTVEWGVAWKGAGPSGVLAFDSEEDARDAVELGDLLSRLTLPWAAVE